MICWLGKNWVWLCTHQLIFESTLTQHSTYYTIGIVYINSSSKLSMNSFLMFSLKFSGENKFSFILVHSSEIENSFYSSHTFRTSKCFLIFFLQSLSLLKEIILSKCITSVLVARVQMYKKLCPSARPSVHLYGPYPSFPP